MALPVESRDLTLHPNRGLVPGNVVESFLTEMSRHEGRFKDQLVGFVSVAEKVATIVSYPPPSEELNQLFIVKLSGVVFDLCNRFSMSPEQSATMIGECEQVARYVAFQNSLQSVRREFSDDELDTIAFRRNQVCHPFLDGYRPTFKKAGPRNATKSQARANDVPIPDLLEACAVVDESYGGFAPMCMAFAQRSAPGLAAVRLRTKELMLPKLSLHAWSAADAE